MEKRQSICDLCGEIKNRCNCYYAGKQPPPDPEIVANVMRCSVCQGIVDKHELGFVCRNCGAIIMTSQSLQGQKDRKD